LTNLAKVASGSTSLLDLEACGIQIDGDTAVAAEMEDDPLATYDRVGKQIEQALQQSVPLHFTTPQIAMHVCTHLLYNRVLPNNLRCF